MRGFKRSICGAGTVLIAFLVTADPAAGQDSLRARAERIHREAIVMDTHSDTTPRFQDDARCNLLKKILATKHDDLDCFVGD